jgi:hypothetical protein
VPTGVTTRAAISRSASRGRSARQGRLTHASGLAEQAHGLGGNHLSGHGLQADALAPDDYLDIPLTIEHLQRSALAAARQVKVDDGVADAQSADFHPL